MNQLFYNIFNPLTVVTIFFFVQPKSKAEADNPYVDLDYSEYHKNLIQ